MMRSGLPRSDLSVITTDGAFYTLNACSQMQLQHQRCFVHSLNRCVMYALELARVGNADLQPIQEFIGQCKRLVTFVNSGTKTHKLLVEAGKQHSETYTTLKQDVATRWNSSYAMLESILKSPKTLPCDFLDDSFEENRQSLLPKVNKFRSICLLCSVLAPFADATNRWEGETYIIASFGHAVVPQLRSELLTDEFDIWRDSSAVEKLR